MAAPEIRGIGPVLKGKVGHNTWLAFSAKNVAVGAKLLIAGKNEKGTAYEWTATFDGTSLSQKKVRVECTKGDTMTLRRGRNRGRPYGAGDVIDVEFTITNPPMETTKVEAVVQIG